MSDMHPRFEDAVDQVMHALRERLIEDVAAAAENGSKRGGIRGEWRETVRRLAALRNATQSTFSRQPKDAMQTSAQSGIVQASAQLQRHVDSERKYG